MTNKLTKGQLLYYWCYQEKCNSKTKFSDYASIKSTGDHLCVFNTLDEAIISVDATDSNKEWKSNFDFNPPVHDFHKGFYTTALAFYNQIYSKIQDKEVTVIGHSRGGGIAPILAFLLQESGIKVNKVVTFAAPRSTTLTGSKKLKNAGLVIHRVEAKLDIVDNAPPRLTLFPFSIWKHYATFVYKLPGVKGCDHAKIGAALKEFIDG